jgi:hypothetical protein
MGGENDVRRSEYIKQGQRDVNSRWPLQRGDEHKYRDTEHKVIHEGEV